jgi:hypothetical protein
MIETLEIARDVARKLLEAQSEGQYHNFQSSWWYARRNTPGNPKNRQM